MGIETLEFNESTANHSQILNLVGNLFFEVFTRVLDMKTDFQTEHSIQVTDLDVYPAPFNVNFDIACNYCQTSL